MRRKGADGKSGNQGGSVRWERIGPTAWECGKFRIAAARVGEQYRYTLFMSLEQLDTYDTSDEAKQMAARLADQ